MLETETWIANCVGYTGRNNTTEEKAPEEVKDVDKCMLYMIDANKKIFFFLRKIPTIYK